MFNLLRILWMFWWYDKLLIEPLAAPSFQKTQPFAVFAQQGDGAVDRIIGRTEEARSTLLTSMSEIVTPDNIQMFEHGEANNIYLIAVSRQGLARSKYYGMRLILGGYEVLKNYAQQGIIAKRLYSVSRTPDGIKLCKNLGFREVIIPGNPVRRFELDLEAAISPFLHEYQQIAKDKNLESGN